MKIEISKLPKNSYRAMVTVPKDDLEAEFEAVTQELAKQVEINGFRRGEAPLKLAAEKIDPAKLRRHVLEHLLPKIYKQIITEHRLSPIVNPRFDLQKFARGEDLVVKVIIVEKPEIKPGDYQTELKKLRGESKVVYGPDGQPVKGSGEKVTIDQVLGKLLEIAIVEVADPLIDEETNRMMAQLIDQTSRLGMTVEEYLAANQKTPESLRQEYRQIAEKTLQSEFILGELGNLEAITVTDEEIDEAIKAAPDEKTRQELSKPEQRWYIKAVLRKNKTLIKLLEYAEGSPLEK